MVWSPAQPPPERPPVGIDRQYTRPGLREEGRVDEDEPEMCFDFGDKDAALGAEDFGVRSSAVEAQDTW